MNDTTLIRTDVIEDISIAPKASIRGREAAQASGLYVIRSLRDDSLPPSAERGTSRSWIPGAWGDPF